MLDSRGLKARQPEWAEPTSMGLISPVQIQQLDAQWISVEEGMPVPSAHVDMLVDDEAVGSGRSVSRNTSTPAEAEVEGQVQDSR